MRISQSLSAVELSFIESTDVAPIRSKVDCFLTSFTRGTFGEAKTSALENSYEALKALIPKGFSDVCDFITEVGIILSIFFSFLF